MLYTDHLCLLGPQSFWRWFGWVLWLPMGIICFLSSYSALKYRLQGFQQPWAAATTSSASWSTRMYFWLNLQHLLEGIWCSMSRALRYSSGPSEPCNQLRRYWQLFVSSQDVLLGCYWITITRPWRQQCGGEWFSSHYQTLFLTSQ